jgi:ABC-2 type transport system ATP-binding protein
VAGFDVKRQGIEAKRGVAYIPQQFPLWPDMSVAEAMRFMGELREVSRPRQLSLLEEFGLAEHRGKSVAALSGGMRQKLSITIALLSDPSVILLDEPTASLDAWATHEILRILEGWKSRKCVVLSSHRVEEVRALAHRLVSIRGGRLAEAPLDGGLACAR